MSRLSASHSAFVCIALGGYVLLFLPMLVDASCTVPGTRPATAEDGAVKLGYITVGTCIDPNDQNIGTSAAQKVEYLRTKLTGAAAARGSISVTRMNPTFACRLADFLKASELAGYDLKIFSGWRDVNAQNAAVKTARPGYACRGGASCPHPQGRAADLLFNGSQSKTDGQCQANPACRWAHANAGRFQLSFPLKTHPLEPWHIEPVERSGVPTSGPCSTGTIFAGDTPQPQSQNSILSPIADALRSMFGQQPPSSQGGESQPQLPPQPQLSPQPLGQQQSPSGAFQPQSTPQASPVDVGRGQQVGTPTGGSSGSSGRVQEQPLSVADKLLSLALDEEGYLKPVEVATTVPISIDGSDVAGVSGGSPQQTASTSPSQGSGVALSPSAPQTFLSADVAVHSSGPFADASPSALQAALAEMREALIAVLAYLQPFGRPNSEYHEHD